jgi:AmiR/NasT family two-component response regulator
MAGSEHARLRVLIADEQPARLERMEQIVRALGHDVIARELDISDAGRATREERPDIALVGFGESSEYALALITRIVHEATCPVIAVLGSHRPDVVAEAAKCGIFAYIDHEEPEELQGAIEVVLRRYAEFRNLEGAFGRRAVIERAKGILMERHAIDEREAFELLRSHSRRAGRRLTDVADAVIDSHLLLPATLPRPAEEPDNTD